MNISSTDQHDANITALTLFAMILALLALCLFQSSALLTLSYDLPPSPTTERVVMVVETWHQWMQDLGAAEITNKMSEQLEVLHELPIAEN